MEVRSLDPLAVEGQAQAVAAFELLGVGPARTRLQALAARELTPFTGRQRELAAVGSALEQARAGYGQVVALVGEPGVGKSRFILEAIHATSAVGWLILEAGALAHARATAYLPFVAFLRGYGQIEARDETPTVREKLVGTVLGLDRELEPSLPALLALLDLPVDNPAWQALDPPQRRRQTLDAVKRLLLRASQQQPLLLVIEDLHWIDGESQALLDSLIESLPAARILLLVSYRPEHRHGWGSKTYYAQLRIDSLPGEDAEALLDGLLGPAPSAAEASPLRAIRQRLIAQTEGNPFFLEECVRTLIETGALAGELEAYRLVKDLPTIEVPATVQAVLMARIDRLPPEQKRVLQTAAVVGTDVPYALLEAIADQAPASAPAAGPGQAPLRTALAQLQAAEFVYEASLFPELEYTFKHALTHDVTYGSLLQERRRTLHARLVEAIEALYPDRLAERTEALANHAFRGERWAQAVTYLRQAGEKAVARSANRDAVGWFEQALEALQPLPENRDTLAQAIDLHLAVRNALFALGKHEQIRVHLRKAEGLAERLGDQRRLGLTALYASTQCWVLGDHAAAALDGRRALAVATALSDFALEVDAKHRLIWAYHSLGDYSRVIDLGRAVIGALPGRLAFERFGLSGVPSVFARTWLAWCLAERGEFAEAAARGEEGLEIAESVGQPWSLIAAYCGLGVVHLYQGSLARATDLLERACTLAQAADIMLWVPISGASLGYSYALSGRLAEAVALLEQAAERTSAGVIRANASQRITYLGEAMLLDGRLESAAQLATRGFELAEAHKERGHQAWALRLLGEIAAHRDPPPLEHAEACYRRAFALAEELGMRPLQAHCHLGLGSLYQGVGRAGPARAELTAAHHLYDSMGMSFWLPRAEAELAEAGVGSLGPRAV